MSLRFYNNKMNKFVRLVVSISKMICHKTWKEMNNKIKNKMSNKIIKKMSNKMIKKTSNMM